MDVRQHIIQFPEQAPSRAVSKVAALGQYMTPVWASAALVERFLPHLAGHDLVVDPACGDGSWLRAIPSIVPALGVDIDPERAQQARLASGRPVVVGDFRTVPLSIEPSCFVGNPPFKTAFIDAMLARCFRMLPWGGIAAFVLPAYAVQTPSRVMSYFSRWSLQVEQLPRTLFPGLSKPLVFVCFRKQEERVLVGLALYEETRDVELMPKPYRELLRRGGGSVWHAVVDTALTEMGGEGTLEEIYAAVGPRRPTQSQFWREKVRQTLRAGFRRTARARYARPEPLGVAA